MPTAKINGINLYYEVHGSGKPMVIILGLSQNTAEHKGITKHFAKSYKVIAFDNRGAGKSDKPDSAYSITMMANDTAGLLDYLDIKDAAILGVSMGGKIALNLAINHSKLVNRLILVCTFPESRKRVKLSWVLHLLKPFRILMRGRHHQPRHAFKKQLRATLDYDAIDGLKNIKAPTLIMYGKKDKIAPRKAAEIMHKGIKGSAVSAFNGGHLFAITTERKRFLDESVKFIGYN